MGLIRVLSNDSVAVHSKILIFLYLALGKQNYQVLNCSLTMRKWEVVQTPKEGRKACKSRVVI